MARGSVTSCAGRIVALLPANRAAVSEAAHQQETVIRGVVTDRDGRPLAGVQVYMQGSQTLEATDSQGRFVLRTAETGSRVLVAFAPRILVVGDGTRPHRRRS